ncbi:RING-H2 FINGER PROTEIN ATL78 [Salix purpurea]|uniref:RING-H2 FINGER PROTEIN ATL78 n=1 Tax=Salix purpurea TaxID=77065 RepID=A0A9Q0ZRP4_SALPP|nr:RING-H2 FINGER PROTEIN ATL78 [Salix purpurea]
MSTTFSTHPLPFQHFHGDFHLRKLLLHNPLSPLPSSNAQDPLNPNATGVKSFNINVFVVFIVLMGALLSSIGLNSFIRHCLVETCRKIAGVSPASSSEQPPPLIQERVVNIAPLEREGVVSNYRGGVIS